MNTTTSIGDEMPVKSYLRHIALVVPDLMEAEVYYRALLGMELVGREATLADGFWYTLPPEKEWADAEAVGTSLKMVALRKGECVLALFAGPAPPGQVFAIGLGMPAEEMAEVKRCLPADAERIIDHPEQLSFRDRYGIAWQLVPQGDEFLMNGDADGRWLQSKRRKPTLAKRAWASS